ncbi:hypothetical protein NIES4071_79100 [Calothrix sp. NIES-4071]|nr:hypothetical protein NIES4071_79100 [Calothrix sp. NIES-4071]BAZ62182.1 hypothetical protein NIES4105_79030 [Calothrix sp. NIES-4105]
MMRYYNAALNIGLKYLAAKFQKPMMYKPQGLDAVAISWLPYTAESRKRGGDAQLVCPEFKQCLRVYLINQVAASSVVLDVGVEDKPRKKAPNVGEVRFVPIFDYHTHKMFIS